MKTIQRFLTPVGFLVAFLALSASGVKGQAFYSTRLVGTFTLPFEAQWGTLTLPAGDYTLEYVMQEGGRHLAYVRSTAKGGPYGMILARPARRSSATKNELVCIRQGDRGFVRALEMPAIGESVTFAMPHGVEVEAKLVSKHQSKSGNTQLAEVRIPIQRVPVKLNRK